MVEYTNPLSLIGRSQVAPTNNSSIQKLQSSMALQNLVNSGAMATAKQRGVDTRRNTALNLGQNLGASGEFDASGLENLTTLRNSLNAGRDSKAFNDLRRGGGIPTIPKGGSTLPDTLASKINLGMFPGEAAETVKGQVLSKQAKEVTKKGVEMGPSGTLEETTRKEINSQEGRTKDGKVTEQRAKEIQDSVRRALKAQGKELKSFTLIDKFRAMINGKEKPLEYTE